MAERFHLSCSFGKDSLCLLFQLIERGYPLDEVVFYNTGMEFKAIYNTRQQVLPILEQRGIAFTEIFAENSFLYDMLERPVRKRGTDIIHKYGYSWCGGTCRWATAQKLRALKKHNENSWDFVGIAFDEQYRINKEARPNRLLPLVEWGITEKDALEYCYNLGFTWEENGIRLYDILDRVSCWCCGNKNLKELKNMFLYLPDYWEKLKELQEQTERPYRRTTGDTIYDLERRFSKETGIDIRNPQVCKI